MKKNRWLLFIFILIMLTCCQKISDTESVKWSIQQDLKTGLVYSIPGNWEKIDSERGSGFLLQSDSQLGQGRAMIQANYIAVQTLADIFESENKRAEIWFGPITFDEPVIDHRCGIKILQSGFSIPFEKLNSEAESWNQFRFWSGASEQPVLLRIYYLSEKKNLVFRTFLGDDEIINAQAMEIIDSVLPLECY